jgi:glycosyltransferase involved in cell wall biosynthesis
VKLQVLRNRGLSPRSVKTRIRYRLQRRSISRERLDRFLADIASRPLPELPSDPPRSIAIVVPCYRHSAYLPETLVSISSQTRAPDEVIFVDDCSPDDSGPMVRSFIAATPWLAAGRGRLLVNQSNLGQAASLNKAIAAASSDLIMILNDDDYLMHDAVERMLGFFAQLPRVALVGCRHIGFGRGDDLPSADKRSTSYAPNDAPAVHTPDDVARLRYAHELDMTHSGQTFLKAAWQSVGGYFSDKKARVVPFSDRDFQIRMAAVWPVAVAENTPLAFWRRDSSVDAGRHS